MVIRRKEENFGGIGWCGSVPESIVWKCCKMKAGGMVHLLFFWVVDALIEYGEVA